jgi:hypothetical protein
MDFGQERLARLLRVVFDGIRAEGEKELVR